MQRYLGPPAKKQRITRPSVFQQCPICGKQVPESTMNHHLDEHLASCSSPLEQNCNKQITARPSTTVGRQPGTVNATAAQPATPTVDHSQLSCQLTVNGTTEPQPVVFTTCPNIVADNNQHLTPFTSKQKLDTPQTRQNSGARLVHQQLCQGKDTQICTQDESITQPISSSSSTYVQNLDMHTSCNGPAHWSQNYAIHSENPPACAANLSNSGMHTDNQMRLSGHVSLSCDIASQPHSTLSAKSTTYCSPPPMIQSTANQNTTPTSGALHTVSPSAVIPPLPPLDMQIIVHAELPGEVLVHNFINSQEEAALIAMCEHTNPPWKESKWNGSYRMKAWGVTHDLRKREILPPKFPMPALLQAIIARMQAAVPQLQHFTPNEANAIDYPQGRAHLTPHADDRQLSKDIICNLSLCGRAVMTFQRQRKGPVHKVKFNLLATNQPYVPNPFNLQVRVLLPQRSLQVLTQDARYSYTHAIAAEDLLDARRISISFRDSPISKQH